MVYFLNDFEIQYTVQCCYHSHHTAHYIPWVVSLVSPKFELFLLCLTEGPWKSFLILKFSPEAIFINFWREGKRGGERQKEREKKRETLM